MTTHSIDTEALRRLADAATPGPWVQNGRNGIHTTIGSCVALTHRHDDDERKADADFIAAARTALPQLLDQLDQAEARVKAVEEVLDSIDTSTEPALHDGFADIRRALDGTVTPPSA